MNIKPGKQMLGVNELIKEIGLKSDKIFIDSTFKIADIFGKENATRLYKIIPEDYWMTTKGRILGEQLCLPLLDFVKAEYSKPSKAELSNLLTGSNGHTAVKSTRQTLAQDLSDSNYIYLMKAKEQFDEWFSNDKICATFELQDLPNVYKYLTSDVTSIKRGRGTSYQGNTELWFDLDIFHKTLERLCYAKRYSEFFWWLFLYSLFQVEITQFICHFPETQYAVLLKFLRNRLSSSAHKGTLFHNTQVLPLNNDSFWDIRRKLVETASGHLIISGPSLTDAFSTSNDHSIVETLRHVIKQGALTKISILVTDPIIFDAHGNCNDPIRDISGAIETLQERMYDVCEEQKVLLDIYFLPLLQIDHAVITEEFMAFRSNKLWNRDRNYKGAFCLYLADYYTPEETNNSNNATTKASEYLAHKNYICTLFENSTVISPKADIDQDLLQRESTTGTTSGKGSHMRWRSHLASHNYNCIHMYKLYEKQIFTTVCDSWGVTNESLCQLIPNSTIHSQEDLFDESTLLNDDTQRILLPYLRETEHLFTRAIRKHASHIENYCRIYPSLDLGFPNNVKRLAGGFATGMLVTWKCGIDIVPIDATVNVCTSSVFKLHHFDPNRLKDHELLNQDFSKMFDKASTEKGYSFSFNSGNHFLIIAKDINCDEYYLVMHSSANELKESYMGLYPVEGNWYSEYIKTETNEQNGRYFRYLKDEDARYFIRMAKNFQKYNEQIHHYLAQCIEDGVISSKDTVMKHHYYMPTDNSIALGTFAEPVGEIVPIFSAPQKNIYLFQIGANNWQIELGGEKGRVCLVPHGWGQKIDGISNIQIEGSQLTFTISGEQKTIDIHNTKHIEFPEKKLRSFEDGRVFLKIGSRFIHGTIVKELKPLFEISHHTEIANKGQTK